MERKNTNLFFLSGIFLLFTLLLIGRSYREQTLKQTKSQSQNIQKSTDDTIFTTSWIKKVSMNGGESDR